jgi:hypothetical protein
LISTVARGGTGGHHPGRVITSGAVEPSHADHPAGVKRPRTATATLGRVSERFDVIIVGTGAGGDHLLRRMA